MNYFKNNNCETNTKNNLNLWRMLDFEYYNPELNIALDHDILLAVERGISLNTLRFWQNINTVVLGRRQNFKSEVDLRACKKFGVSIVKRFTGGGAVYQDYGNLNWSVIARRDYPIVPNSIPKIFKVFSKPIIKAVKTLGINVKFVPPNSIYIDEFKISGMAGYIKSNSILCHGTLLLNTNLKVLSLVLKNIKAKVTTLKDELDKYIQISSIKESIKNSFEHIYGLEFCP